MDAINVGPDPPSWSSAKLVVSPVEMNGGVVTRSIGETGAIAYVNSPIAKREDLERYEPPSAENLTMKGIEGIVREAGGGALILAGIGMEGTFSYQLMGFEGTLKALHTDPDLVRRANEMILYYTLDKEDHEVASSEGLKHSVIPEFPHKLYFWAQFRFIGCCGYKAS